MAYDEGLAERIRSMLTEIPGIVEKKMFGGLAFMLNGNMCCGIIGNELMLRVGPKQYDRLLLQPYVRQMDFTGRPMKGLVYVSEKGFEEDGQLQDWIGRALTFVRSLPVK